MNTKLVSFIGALMCSAVVTPAMAAVVTFTGSTATWSDVIKAVPTTPVGSSGNGTSTAVINWGFPAYPNPYRSSWKFATVATNPITIAQGSDSALFTVADFTHTNRPINQSITGAKLTFVTDVNVDGADLGTKTFIFDFTLDETPNETSPCAYGGANYKGVNINGCADKVTFNYNASSDSFTVGSAVYTLNLYGFVIPGTTNAVSDFLTREKAINTAQIVGQLDVATTDLPVDPVIEDPATTVPEPAAWSLMFVGLGLAGGALRRRQAAGSRAAA